MLKFDEMLLWSRRFDLVSNRVQIVNQLLGCRYDFSPTNPMRLVRTVSGYDVTFDGEVLASFRIWDLADIDDAIGVVEQWSSCVWRLGRYGVLAT